MKSPQGPSFSMMYSAIIEVPRCLFLCLLLVISIPCSSSFLLSIQALWLEHCPWQGFLLLLTVRSRRSHAHTHQRQSCLGTLRGSQLLI